ncbi:MAG TPA: aminotransferase class V-fold PLP-dependent enzyme [Pirellulales bacterium]|jgi:cysteine desulfurase family protein|nr:aminotransferase class V-fold PLP-dependent enzyme [Pirellulales bacterium]
MQRIYLDHAATSWPKPEAVYRAVEHCLRKVGAPAGRGAYAEAVEASQIVSRTRRSITRLIGAADANHVIFTHNGTDALNLALHGLLDNGTDQTCRHVVTTVAEHNSVLRPLRHLELAGRIRVTRIGCDAAAVVALDAMRAAIDDDAYLVAVTHASNVTGALQPIEAIAELARRAGALLLVDAAQTLGDVPIDVAALGVDLLAAPGHKGLLGPLGTGVLYVRPGIERQLASIRQGGTGSDSQFDRQPETLPEKYEAGNLNVPAIAGLGAGVDYLLERGVSQVREHGERLTSELLEGLREIRGVRLYGPAAARERVGIVSLTLAGCDPHELAAMLDGGLAVPGGYRIQARAGYHCAGAMHADLGTLEMGGTLRFSLGAMSTSDEVSRAVHAMRVIAGSLVGT